MSVLVNGIANTHISALDRGAMYGQCIFETIAISNGKACLLDAHLQRLKRGAEVLNISYNEDTLISELNSLTPSIGNAVLRINLTMGEGGRGYANPEDQQPTRILSLHDYPIYPESFSKDGIELGLANIRLSQQPALAGIKHGNRLEQIIARSEWQNSWNEALLMDIDENIIEATQSNVFIVLDDTLITPCLKSAGVAGVMRECVIELAQSLQLSIEIKSITVDDVMRAEAVFLTNSIIGIWPVRKFKNTSYKNLTISSKLLKIIKENEFIPTI